MKNILQYIICFFILSGSVKAQNAPEVEYYDNGALKSIRDDTQYQISTTSGEISYRKEYYTQRDSSRGDLQDIISLGMFTDIIGDLKTIYQPSYLTVEKILRISLKEVSYSKELHNTKVWPHEPDDFWIKTIERVENVPLRIAMEEDLNRDAPYFFRMSETDFWIRYYDGVKTIQDDGDFCYTAAYINGVFIESTPYSCSGFSDIDAAERTTVMELDKDSYMYNLSDFLKLFLFDISEAEMEYQISNRSEKSHLRSNPYLSNFYDQYKDSRKIPAFPFGKNGLDAELVFKSLDGDQIAVSNGRNDDSKVILAVDPVKWANASTPKKWYIIYHELGHDVLNLNHGEGGRMMFNFPLGEYTWDDFFQDRDYMFKYVFDRFHSK